MHAGDFIKTVTYIMSQENGRFVMSHFKRLVTLAVISTCIALPAAAKSKKDKFCEELAYASQQMADLRIDGSSEEEVRLMVAAQYEDDQVTHLQMMPYLSAFVYGLNKEQLSEDVEAAFSEQCKGYKG
jgi:hypothetical protein